MKYISKILLIVCVSLLGQYAAAQPPKRKNEAAAKEAVAVNVPMTDRAKAQYPTNSTPTEVMWKREMYRTLDLKKEKNASLYYPVEPQGDNMNLFTYLFKLFIANQIPAYSYNLDGNESFTADNRVNVKELLDNFGIYYEVNPARATTYEGWNTASMQLEQFTELVAPASHGFHIGTDNIGANLYVAFYFNGK